MTEAQSHGITIIPPQNDKSYEGVQITPEAILSSLTSNPSTARFIEDEAAGMAMGVLRRSVRLPFVRVNRDVFLREALSKIALPDVIEQAIATTPALAGIPLEKIDVVANQEVARETYRVAGVSFFAGVPGGTALLATVPADVAQYFAHMMRIEQKLAYLYGWQSMTDDHGRFTEDTMNSLIALMGVMLEVEGVDGAVRAATVSMAQQGMVKYAKRRAILQSIDQPVLRAVLNFLGRKLGEESAKKVAGKLLPLIGGVISGGMSYRTFKPSALRLQAYLRTLPTASATYIQG